jgi:hypothetical protein
MTDLPDTVHHEAFALAGSMTGGELWDNIEAQVKEWRVACCDEEGKDLLAFLQGDSPPTTEQGSASMNIDLTDGIITVRHGTTDAILHRGVAPKGTWSAIWELIRRNVKEESA